MTHPAGHITESLGLGEIDARHRGTVLHVWVDGPDMETLAAHLSNMRACHTMLMTAPWSELAQGALVLWLYDAWGMEPPELDAFVARFGPIVYIAAARRSAAMLAKRACETFAALALAHQLGRLGTA